MIDQATYQQIGRWIAKLRRMTAAGSEDVSAEQLGEYAAWLAADFPLTVFTDASCKAMAQAGPWFPAWAVLHAFVTDWHVDHPATPRIAGPKLDPWLYERILAACGNEPGPELHAWLDSRGVKLPPEFQSRTSP